MFSSPIGLVGHDDVTSCFTINREALRSVFKEMPDALDLMVANAITEKLKSGDRLCARVVVVVMARNTSNQRMKAHSVEL